MGEVDVALGAGLAVLPRVVGLAVAAARHILTRAIGELRLAGTLCTQTKQNTSILIHLINNSILSHILLDGGEREQKCRMS